MKRSLETRQKISESMKGNKNRLGKTFSEETLQKRSKINKDKKVYNNGERNVFWIGAARLFWRDSEKTARKGIEKWIFI